MQTIASELRTIEIDKVTSTNLIFFETNNHDAFYIMIEFLEIVNTFHLKLENDRDLKNPQAEEEKLEQINSHMVNKFELEVVHRYLNTLLLDGEYNREDNIKILLGFYDKLHHNDRETINCIDQFAKQIPITTDPFITLKIEEEAYQRIMKLFTGESYISRTGFNQSLIMTSKLFSTLHHLIDSNPTPSQLFMYYLGTRYSRM